MNQVITFAVLSLLAIQAFRVLAVRYGVLLDNPSGRKQHFSPTPCVGGLGVIVAVLGGALASGQSLTDAPLFYIGLTGILILGLADDLLDLSPKVKLLIEAPLVAGALLMFARYPEFGTSAFLTVSLAKAFGLCFAIFLMLGFINALNMTDGIDGLAGSLSLYFALIVAGFTLKLNHPTLTWISLSLVGALAGFLLLNFRTPFGQRAAVFLGDAGSMALGFTLGWLALSLAQNGMPEELVLWFMSYPAFDAVSTAVRRVLKGHNPMEGDRTHMHHMLPEMGLSNTHTVLAIVTISALFTALGVFLWHSQVPPLALTAIWLATGAAYVICSMFIEKQVTK